MNWFRAAAIFLVACWLYAVHGQPSQMPLIGVGGKSSAGAYVGPGDVVSGAAAWWGMRAYSAASIGNNVVKIRRSSDNTTKVFVSIAGGGINTSDVFLDGSNYFVDTLYDQSGNGLDAAQSTTANQPAITLSGLSSKPVLSLTFASNQVLVGISGLVLSQAFSLSAVANSTNNSHQQTVLGDNQGNDAQLGFDPSGSNANTVQIYAGSTATATASDGSWHAFQGVFNSSSSVIHVDSSDNTGLNAGTHNWAGDSPRLFFDGGTNYFNGSFAEGGWWPGGFSSGQRSSMNSNQHTYWGF